MYADDTLLSCPLTLSSDHPVFYQLHSFMTVYCLDSLPPMTEKQNICLFLFLGRTLLLCLPYLSLLSNSIPVECVFLTITWVLSSVLVLT